MPPAVFKLRRATDRYMAVGFVAVALFMWVLVLRVAWRADWSTVAFYAAPTLLMSYAAAGMTRLLFRHWERRPTTAGRALDQPLPSAGPARSDSAF